MKKISVHESLKRLKAKELLFLKNAQLINLFGVSDYALAKWRNDKEDGIKYYKFGGGMILYANADVREFMKRRKLKLKVKKEV